MKTRVIVLGVFAMVLIGVSSVGTAGLVAHYSLDGDLADDSGNGNDGTFEGTGGGNSAATFVDDPKFGSALDFDGTDDRVGIGALFTLQNRSWSISMWVKAPATANTVPLIGKNSGDTGFGAGERVFEITGNQTWGNIINPEPAGNFAVNGHSMGGVVTDQAAVSLDDDQWHMLTAVHDDTISATHHDLYIDGVLQTPGPQTMNNNAQADVGTFFLGFSNYSGHPGGYLSGQMAEVNFYDSAIDQAAVTALFNADYAVGAIELSELRESGVTATSIVLHATLNVVGTNCDVYAHWGVSNGMENTAAWDHSAYVGSWTNVTSNGISHAVDGLSAGTLYYYTFRATNDADGAWAPASERFGTFGKPVVNNASYTSAVGYATLCGDLVATSGAPTSVRIYWGESDGGTTAASWAHTNTLGGPVDRGLFCSDTSGGLLYGVQYYFRCYASNVNGGVWAPATATFETTYSGTGGAPSPALGTTNPATGTPWAIGDTYHLAFVSSTVVDMTNRHDIHYWNEYVNTVAAGSSLPGIPDLTWKVIGSDMNHHARDNALVTAPVFLVDATTRIADGYDYMWNGSIDAALNKDESGNPGAGDVSVWTGSGNNGASAGSRSFNGTDATYCRRGERHQANGSWISRDDRDRKELKHLYALSQPIQILGGAADTNSPVPETMTWADAPNGLTPTTIDMRATLAYDLESPPIEYLFTNTVTHEATGWQSNRTWTNTVAVNSVNTYMVKARDAVGNETAWSAPHAATPLLSGPGGLVAPTGIHPTNGTPWQAGDVYHLAFVSSTVTNMAERHDIHFWNEYVKALADASGLPGVSNLTWKVVGSDTAHHARDNALVTAPVYLLDGTTKIVDGYAYMWNGSIDAKIDIDENGNPGSDTADVWTGTSTAGASAGYRSFDGYDVHTRYGHRTYNTGWWVHRGDHNRSTYSKHVYALSQPIRIASGAVDNEPPSPDPMTWAAAPNGLATNTISMKATMAHDLDSPAVEYFFTNTVTHEVRGWDVDRTWVNTVAPYSVNTYMVKARDAVGNETAWSAPHSATPLNKGPGGVIAPTGIHPTRGTPWQAGDTYHLAFVSSTVTNMESRGNIHFWNDYVKGLAEGSSLTGLSNLTWKVIGSDARTHARDNAFVTAPVYLLDASTKIVDGYTDMWNGNIDNPLDKDEHGNRGAGTADVWLGSLSDGTTLGYRSFDGTDIHCGRGHRNHASAWWAYRDVQRRDKEYHVYGLSQPLRIAGGAVDSTPPSPDPMTFAVLPEGSTPTTIRMRATLAVDLDSLPVEYLFTNTTTQTSSGWQSSHDWTDSVTRGWANTYRVKARDGVGNETGWSEPYTIKPLLEGPNGVITPPGINPLTGELWTGGDTYHLAFVTSTTDDLNPAQDITYWNSYVNTVADGSSLTGVPETTWKIIGSTTNDHARDNALVSGPVYLVDAVTKLADGYEDMWDGQIDAPLNLDENGAPGAGSGDIWSGSTSSGTKNGIYALDGSHTHASRGHRTVSHGQWLYRDNQVRSGKRHFYALSEPLTIPYTAVNVVNGEAVNIAAGTADLVGTVYAPQGQSLDVSVYWSTNNNADGAAWLADGAASSKPIGTFADVVGLSVTGAVDSLASDVTYYYTLFGENAEVSVWGGVNVPFSVDTEGPTPDPMRFAGLPEPNGPDEIRMTAVTATDTLSLPVEYYFENVSNGGNSGWIASPSWAHTGLANDTTYGFRVQARDAAGNTNGWSEVASAKTGIPSSGLVAYWTFDDADVSGTTILDVADDTSDGKGDHDATMMSGIRRSTDLPGDPDGGMVGKYYDANGNGYALVDTLGNGATDGDLEAGEQFTVAGWFRERPDGNSEPYISKRGEDNRGWQLRRNGNGNQARFTLRGTSGGDDSSTYNITSDNNGGPWYFMAASYTKESDTNSTLRFYAADSGATNKSLGRVGNPQVHNPDNDAAAATNDFVALGALDRGNIQRYSNTKMDDVAIWNRGLTLDEIAAWYGLSYFSGLKANDAAIQVLLNGGVGTAVTGVGPHGHDWMRITNTNGAAGDISGSIATGDALIQINASNALEYSIGGIGDDMASTDEETPVSIAVLLNDEVAGALGHAGELEITAVTQPVEGAVAIDVGEQSLTFDPTGSTALRELLAGETSVQTFTYTAKKTAAADTATGTVTVTVGGLASFGDALVAHWTFDDADVSGRTVHDIADDTGDGRGDHDATLYGGLRPDTDLPGDPDGGPIGNYYDANYNKYGVVDSFGGGAAHGDLDAGDQFTVAGWFRELPDGNEDAYISKEGNTYGWDIRRNGSGDAIRTDLRGTSGGDNPSAYTITNNVNGGPWYFVAVTYTKESEYHSKHRFYTADSGATNKVLRQRGGAVTHSADNDASATGSMVVFGGRDNTHHDTSPPAIDRHSGAKMDDIAFWNRGLSMEEVSGWYGLSYFSGLKATNTAIATLLDGGVGTSVAGVGPHGHNWTRISTNGTPGDISGSVAGDDALVQITATEALQLSLQDAAADDEGATDEETAISIAVLVNDKIGGVLGNSGGLEVIATTQPAEGAVSVDVGEQSLTFDPSGSTVLHDLLVGETSVQTFDYTARNKNTLATDTGTVTVTVNGLPSFGDALVAHWTFDDADALGQTVYDIADDSGFGKGDHDATLYGGTRPSDELPGDPDGGHVGNYFDANGNDYGVVNSFGGAAAHGDLEAGEQFTVAGWFREQPDNNEDPYISKYGDGGRGWDLRRPGWTDWIRGHVRGTSGADNTADYTIESDVNGGPWYFLAMTYTKETDDYSTHGLFAADSDVGDKGLSRVGGVRIHSPDNDVTPSGSMVVFGAYDTSNNDSTPHNVGRTSNTKMDDIAIWNRGLSMEEVTAWYGLSYFSGLKATDTAITTLLDGVAGTVVTGVGPHNHNWTKINTNGTAGDISGSVAGEDALVQITATEALQLSIPDVVADDTAATDERTAVSIAVLNNDKIDGGTGGSGALAIVAATQPAEGAVTVDGGGQSLTFDPSGSTVLRGLLAGETSVQTFDYTARNTNTLTEGTGTVTVTVSGLASFSDALVAHWTFDDADVSGQMVYDLADDAGFGKGDHDATLYGGTRPSGDLPGDPDGGPVGNYFDANGNDYGVVDTFGGGATHSDLEANDQFTMAGWFRELGDENEAVYLSKDGNSRGWDLRRHGSSSQVRGDIRYTDGTDNTTPFTIVNDMNDGPWYFLAMTYTKEHEYNSSLRFFTADSGATDKGLNQVGGAVAHSPDNDVEPCGSMVVFGAYDSSNNDTTAPSIGRAASAKMDDIAIWNRGLSIEEVAAWYGLSYFSGLKATDTAITTLLDGEVGTSVTFVGPHGHNWTRISTNGTAGDISGSVAGEDALVQITATEALLISLPDVVADDAAATDDETAISIGVLNNDKIDGEAGGSGALEIVGTTQPSEGVVTIDGGSMSLTFDPTGSTVLHDLQAGETSVQTFDYTARNTNTLTEGTGTVTVTVNGLASFGDGLVGHWTFDDAHVSGQLALDVADDAGYGKGDHDATLYGGLRPKSDLPGDPDGGLAGNYFDANGNDYAVVDTFGGAAAHTDLDANDQFTVAGWFRERPDGNEDCYISKYGDNYGWEIRRSGSGSSVRHQLQRVSNAGSSSSVGITSDNNGGPWYFFAVSYTKESEIQSVRRFYTADSDAANKRLALRWTGYHSPDNDSDSTGSMMVMGARDNSNNAFNGPSIDRHSGSKMDDIAFWNRGLSLEELTAWYGLGYFSGLKATNTAIMALVEGSIGTSVTNVGPHGHNWAKVSASGTAGDISGSVAGDDALVQITATEALQLSLPDGASDDVAATDERTAVSIAVLVNDKVDGALGSSGDLEIIATTQPAEGAVAIDGGGQSLTFNPSGSPLLRDLLAGETSVQMFDYTARNRNTLSTDTGTVTVTVSGLASFGDALVGHWTFDDDDVSGNTILDLADDAGFGKGDHDATQNGGTRPDTDLPGDPDGGPVGNYFDANGNGYTVVDTFAGAAAHTDLDANDQFTVAGWFRERPDGNEDCYISKYGDNYGWEIRRSGSSSSLRTQLQRVSDSVHSGNVGITGDNNGGPWYFIAVSYTKENAFRSVRRFYTADSDAASKRLSLRWTGVQSPDNDSDSTGSMMVIGARDNSNNAGNNPAIDRHSGAKMDDIAFWNRGLTHEELTAWYGLSFFSGLKANDPAIATLLDGPVGTAVGPVGPHGHGWKKIARSGTAGDVSGSVLGERASIQISGTEALELDLRRGTLLIVR